MEQTPEAMRRERQRLKADYLGLYDQVQSLLFRRDPIGINFESNTDEYDPELGTILPRLRGCASAEEVCRVVHEEFVRWFGAETAGSQEHYSAIGTEIWHLWQTFRSAEPGGPATQRCHSAVTEGPPSVG